MIANRGDPDDTENDFPWCGWFRIDGGESAPATSPTASGFRV
jgi:hypothetical protein